MCGFKGSDHVKLLTNEVSGFQTIDNDEAFLLICDVYTKYMIPQKTMLLFQTNINPCIPDVHISTLICI